jgi:transcriptional regulator with XRE-family HTH domain
MKDTVKEVKAVCDNIKFLRQFKKLSQEAMAEKLDLSVNAYANMERGESDITLNRLYKVSQILEINLPQLLGLDEKGVLYLIGNYAVHTQHTQFTGSLLTCPLEHASLKIELEKTQLLLEQKDKEIHLLQQQTNDLREMVQLLKIQLGGAMT